MKNMSRRSFIRQSSTVAVGMSLAAALPVSNWARPIEEKTPADTDKDGFVSIFDGKTLKGWEALPAETAPAWTVKNGMIVGDGDKGRGYLSFENKEIADLEIELSYRFPGKGNNFKFFINGKLSSEFTEYLPAEKRLHRGMIQLQLHDPGMIVQFKDIRLKILK